MRIMINFIDVLVSYDDYFFFQLKSNENKTKLSLKRNEGAHLKKERVISD